MGNGVCKHLDREADACTIYETRPEICQIDNSYPLFSGQMTLIEYYLANAEVCNALQAEHKSDSSKRVFILGVN